MDAEGLEAVTMRRVAREVGVEAMSLYNHVADKEDLLDGVCARVMADFRFPDEEGDWVADRTSRRVGVATSAQEPPERARRCSPSAPSR